MDGFLLVYKEKDCTSFDIVKKIQILSKEKAGHLGTLDPFACGLLPVAVGKATKAIEYLMEKDKEYLFDIYWGKHTDSLDITGKVLEENNKIPEEKDVLQVLSKFTGEIEQIPPIFSALKINGERAYKLARRGEEVKMKSRRIMIYDLKYLSSSKGRTKFQVKCSKGTYVRSLARDIAESLGCLGTVSFLERVAVSGFENPNIINGDFLFKEKDKNNLKQFLMPIEAALSFLPYYDLAKEDQEKLRNGQQLFIKNLPFKKSDVIRVSIEGKLCALAKYEDEMLKPKKLFI